MAVSSLRERWRQPDVTLTGPICTQDMLLHADGTVYTTTVYADIVVGNPRPTLLRIRSIGFQARGRRSWWGRRIVEDLSKHERMARLEQPEYLQTGDRKRVRVMHSGYEVPRDIRVVVTFRDRFKRRWVSNWTTQAFAEEVAEHNRIRQRREPRD